MAIYVLLWIASAINRLAKTKLCPSLREFMESPCCMELRGIAHNLAIAMESSLCRSTLKAHKSFADIFYTFMALPSLSLKFCSTITIKSIIHHIPSSPRVIMKSMPSLFYPHKTYVLPTSLKRYKEADRLPSFFLRYIRIPCLVCLTPQKGHNSACAFMILPQVAQ